MARPAYLDTVKYLRLRSVRFEKNYKLGDALNFITLCWHIVVFSRRIATEKIAIPRSAIGLLPRTEFESGIPKA
jgi:hypothetical protein